MNLSVQKPETRGDRSITALMPASIECEITVLGILMFQNELMTLVVHRLRPDLFSLQGHQIICHALLDLFEKNSPFDALHVATHLSAKNELEKAGGQMALMNLLDSFVSTANLQEYLELLEDKWRRREAIRIGDRLIRQARASDAIADSCQNAIDALSNASAGGHGGDTLAVEEIMVDVFAQIEQTAEAGGLLGVMSDFYDLDAVTQGFQPNNLVIVAARPAMGKTAFMLQIAQAIASNGGKPIVIFSLEMSKTQLVFRLLSMSSGLLTSQIRRGLVQDDERFGTACLTISGVKIFINDSCSTVDEMFLECKKIQRQHGELGGICVDYLQLMDGTEDNRVQSLSKITRAFKKMSGEGSKTHPGFNCTVFVLSQLSRGVESRTNKRPMMSDLRESGAIEQDADLVLMLYRDEYYNPDSPDRGIAEIIIAKHRNGPVGTVKLLFEPHATRFKNLARR